MQINYNFTSFPASYLFSEIARKVREFQAKNPEAKVISLGIGDVTKPLSPSVIKALHASVDEMGVAETFRGYGPEQGYAFLRETIQQDYAQKGITISADDVFISDGAKSDIGNFQELFGPEAKIAVTDPVYPVYVDSNAMSGRAGQFNGQRWSNLVYLNCTEENNFVPPLPSEKVDCIYLCYPNNPTGSVLTKDELAKFVQYAKENQAIILYDSAYEAFIQDENIPRSIYEVEGASEVAVEFRSFSKTAGFTGLRCGYVVVPETVRGFTKDGQEMPLKNMWNRRQTTKFNGTPYIVQKAAEAVYSAEGKLEVQALVGGYMESARKIRQAFQNMGLSAFGGENAPYIWVKTPNNMPSHDFFDQLLEKAHLICTPGAGFGLSGEGYFRLTSFAHSDNINEAIKRLEKAFG